jgi:quercetin 2,3-dioxygenase
VSVRVVPGEISAKDVTTRVTLPNATLPRWPPFERVAEMIATPRRAFPPHRHEGVEVVTYVIEGAGQYGVGGEAPVTVGPGSASLLSAPTAVPHSLNAGKGQTIRWFALVASLPSTATGPPRAVTRRFEPSRGPGDGTLTRHIVGPGTGITSDAGLDCEVIEFAESGDAFRRIGHDRVGVIYTLNGRGAVDNASIEAGEAALVEEAAGVAIHGRASLQVIVATAPRGT